MSLRLAATTIFGKHMIHKFGLAPQMSVVNRALSHYPINDNIFGLDEDKQRLRETCFNFFQKELAPFAKDIDKTDDFP